MIRLSTLRSRPRPSWTWWLLMCCGLCPCYRSSVLYGSVDAANAGSSTPHDGTIQLEQLTDMEDDTEADFFEVGLTGDDDEHLHAVAANAAARQQQHVAAKAPSAVEDVTGPNADVVRDILSALSRKAELPGKVSSTSVTLPLIPLGSRGLSMLSQALFSHPTLLTLELISNNIGGTAPLIELSQLLTLTRSLTSLTLSHNELSDQSVRQLSVGLRENASLRSLNLSNNALTDGGLQSLCAALADNRGLERLDVSGNLSIGDLTVDALLDSERKRRRRRKREEKERERQLANTSSSPMPLPPPSPSSQRGLTHLTLSSNVLSPHSAPSLIELMSLSSLVYLDVSSCMLDDTAAELLVEEAVERAKTLRTLRVEGNEIGERTRRRVDAWRKWVGALEDPEEKRREETREFVVDAPKPDKKPRTNGARSRPRSERNSATKDTFTRKPPLDGDVGSAAPTAAPADRVEVVVHGGDGSNGVTDTALPPPRVPDVPPPPDGAFTIDEDPVDEDADGAAAADSHA